METKAAIALLVAIFDAIELANKMMQFEEYRNLGERLMDQARRTHAIMLDSSEKDHRKQIKELQDRVIAISGLLVLEKDA